MNEGEKHINYEAIPDELKAHAQWVWWKAKPKDDGKLDKIPMDAKTGKNASHSDSQTWADFDQVKSYHEAHEVSAGVGFVFSKDDDYVGVDLDNCRNKETGEIAAWAREFIELANTYSEISPSGKGVKMILKGVMPSEKGRRKAYQSGAVEMYSQFRFFTITGQHLDGTPTIINHNTDAIVKIYMKVFGASGDDESEKPTSKTGATPKPSEPISDDDNALIEKAKAAKDGNKFKALWEGNWEGLGFASQSEADLALCSILAFWTQGDAIRIDTLFRQSGLYRDKWEREDYLESTISKALENTAFYNPQSQSPHAEPLASQAPPVGKPIPKIKDSHRIEHLTNLASQSRRKGARRKEIIATLQKENKERCNPPLSDPEVIAIANKVAPALNPVRADELLEMELQAPTWAIPGFIPVGLTILAGRPKVGKSYLGLGLAFAVGVGGRAFGKIQVEQGEALYIGLEDSLFRLQERLEQMRGETRPEKLYLLTELPRLDAGGLNILGEWLDEHPSVRLVVIDTLEKIRPTRKKVSDAYAEDYSVVGSLQKFALSRGIALMLIHHTRKAEADDVWDEISGTTGISGAADTLMVIKRTTDKTTLHITGRDVESQEYAMRFDGEYGIWELLGDAKEFALSEQRREIIELLEAAEEPLAPKDIASIIQKEAGAVRYLIHKLEKEGLIEKIGHKYFAKTANTANTANTTNTANALTLSPNVSALAMPQNAANAPDTSQDGISSPTVSGVSGVSAFCTQTPPIGREGFDEGKNELQTMLEKYIGLGTAVDQIKSAYRQGVSLDVCEEAAKLWLSDNPKDWAKAGDTLIIAIQTRSYARRKQFNLSP